MRIECDIDPDSVIDHIGDKFFSVCYDHNFLNTSKIIDCEDGVSIEISSDYGKEFNLKAAEALVKLLNQEYNFIPSGE